MKKPGGMAAFLAASAIGFFGMGTTFSSLGVVSYAMGQILHWSDTAIGSAYMALCLSCCFSAMLPVVTIPRMGARWTIAGGGGLLVAGFALAAVASNLALFLVACCLFGVAFSLLANSSCVYLIAGWYGARAPRMIGLYLMISALGGAAGPPAAQALISGGGWRLYWQMMTAIGLALSAACAWLISEPPSPPVEPDGQQDGWNMREVMFTPQFLVLAGSMVATQLCVTTVSGVTPPHMVGLGGTADFAAAMLGLQALIGTVATGASGWLSERMDARRMQAVGLLAEALGMGLLAYGKIGWPSYAFALMFGIGWAVACLTVTVLLVRYFGNKRGTAALSAIWMLCGVAAFGPSLAGYVADQGHGFGPVLAAMGAVLVPLAFASLVMRAPGSHVAEAGKYVLS